MTVNDRQIFEFLDGQAGHRVPDYLDDILTQTRRTRQRPAWTSIERWLPVDISASRAGLARPLQLRPILVFLVIALLVAALVAVSVATRKHLPPPFGLAGNGLLYSSGNGDIVVVDPVTLTRRTVIGGDSFDFGPGFSRDGTKLTFLRGAPAGCGKPDCGLMLMIATADGSGVRALTPGLLALDWADWSPDSKQIALDFSTRSEQGHHLAIVNADGSGGMTTLELGRPVHELSWLPPTGAEIVFRGEKIAGGDPPPGIFAVRPDGTGLRELTTRPAHSDNDFQSVAVSPDGNFIAYRDDGDPGGFQQHFLDLRTGTDRILPGPKGQYGAVFSPDGSKVAFLRDVADDKVQLVVAPLDGSSEGIELGPAAPFGNDGPTINNYSWSPDGTAVLANYDAEKVARLLPIDGSAPIDLDHGDLALPAYQRVAP
jgi:Tol biopolymer transport system component